MLTSHAVGLVVGTLALGAFLGSRAAGWYDAWCVVEAEAKKHRRDRDLARMNAMVDQTEVEQLRAEVSRLRSVNAVLWRELNERSQVREVHRDA